MASLTKRVALGLALPLLVLFAPALFAQTGSVVGHVTDEHGVPVQNKTVEALSPTGEVLASVRTQAEGYYEIQAISAGICRLATGQTEPECSVRVKDKSLLTFQDEVRAATFFHINPASSTPSVINLKYETGFVVTRIDPHLHDPDLAVMLYGILKGKQPTPSKPSPTINGAVSKLPPDSERWALVIGINKYDDENLNPLYGQNDAKKIAADLHDYAGFPELQIILLSDDQPPDRQPNRERILFWLSSIKQNVSASGLILIAFSGHGLQSGGASFLMPKEAHLNFDPVYLTQNAIKVDDVTSSLRESQAKQVIVLVDACRNNPYAAKGDTQNQMTPAFADSFDYAKQNLGKEAYATVFATSVGGEAYQYQAKKMGYFSWVVDQALRGAAYDANGRLTLAGLIRYLQEKTPPLVKLYNPGREQVPYAVVGGYLADQLVLAGKRVSH